MNSDEELIATFLEEALDILDSWEDACAKLEAEFAPSHVNQLFRAAHNLKGASRSVQLGDLANFIHSIEDILIEIRDKSIKPDISTLTYLFDLKEVLVQWIRHLFKDKKYSPDITNHAKKIAKLRKSLGKNQTGKPEISGGLTLFGDAPEVPKIEVDATKPAGDTISENGTLKIKTKKIDNYIRNTAELTVHISILSNKATELEIEDSTYIETLSLCKKIVSELHEDSLSMRLQSVDALFKRLTRVAKDTARTLGKEVNIETVGSEVELDKFVLDQIKDPMIHIIRNAVDHGIESPSERKKTTKNPVPTLKIAATNLGDTIKFSIGDDGKGINQKAVLKKAIASNFLKKPADELTPQEIIQLIFAPGLSTAEKVTDISGRGVGMDVLKKSIEDLNGSILVESVEGNGTTFSISIPTNLSIVDALIINVAGENFAVPILDIKEVVNLDDFDISPNQIANIRGDIVSTNKLESFLHLKTKKDEALPKPKDKPAIVFESAKNLLAFTVDKIVGIESLIINELFGSLKKTQGISGSTVTSSGMPIMIVHLPSIASRCLEQTGRIA